MVGEVGREGEGSAWEGLGEGMHEGWEGRGWVGWPGRRSVSADGERSRYPGEQSLCEGQREGEARSWTPKSGEDVLVGARSCLSASKVVRGGWRWWRSVTCTSVGTEGHRPPWSWMITGVTQYSVKIIALVPSHSRALLT